MGIFSRKTTQKGPAKSKEAKSLPAVDEVLTPESQNKAAAEKVITNKAGKGQAGMSYRLLHSPRVSEKAAVMASHNVYVLNVPVEAEKVEIAKAIQSLFGVTVLAVRTARGIGKRTTRGRQQGQRKNWKKAYVTIKPGQKIDLYEGV